jgi:D-serine deaminase-like pyridoxal phosphate-dependent protein
MTPPDPALWAPLYAAGDEAVMPAGSCLTRDSRPGRHCYVILEGRAAAEVSGRPVLDLAAGSYIGSVDQAGRPVPPVGITVRLCTPARVLVFEDVRLAALIEADPRAAGAWRRLSPACYGPATAPADPELAQ